jgi:predicted RNA-binding protein with PUA-like domain
LLFAAVYRLCAGHFYLCRFLVILELTVTESMNYWLVKSEPSVYSFDDLVRDKKTGWDGVRNYAARLNLKAMKKGDLAFVYHSMEDKAVVGIARITKEAYPDPKDENWVAVELAPDKKLKKPVTLAQIKADKRLKDMALVKLSRLSVQPVKREEFDIVIALSEEK